MSTFEDMADLTTFKTCKDETISRKVMGEILEAGRQAPSPKNIQALEFIVIEDDEKLEKLADLTGDDRVGKAPTSVVMVVDTERMKRKLGEMQTKYASHSEASVAAQNMRIIANNHGISSIWLSGFDEKRVSDLVKLPDSKKAVSILSFAYTNEPVPQDPRYRLNQICYYDEYDNKLSTVFDSLDWKGMSEETRIYGKKAKGALDKIKRKIT